MPSVRCIFIMLVGVAVLISSCDKSTEPEEKVSDYVVASVSDGNPSFSFPKETGTTMNMSNTYQYDQYGRISSFTMDITFVETGNTYDISCYNIVRNQYGAAQSFKADVTVVFGGKTISGTLTYP